MEPAGAEHRVPLPDPEHRNAPGGAEAVEDPAVGAQEAERPRHPDLADAQNQGKEEEPDVDAEQQLHDAGAIEPEQTGEAVEARIPAAQERHSASFAPTSFPQPGQSTAPARLNAIGLF